MELDVLVVGAGPVGLAMAAELARYGVAVRIVEKAAARTDKSKALVVWSRTLEMLDRMGCGAAFLATGMQVHGATVMAGKEQIAHVSFDDVASPHPYGLMIPQSETERLLEEHLATLGVRVERSVELLEFAGHGAGVRAKLRHADGGEETVEAGWLVGSDGAHSTVRHQLGVEFGGDTLPSDWILGDLHLTGVPVPNEVVLGWHAEGLIALFPITGDRYRVIADAGSGQPHRPDPTLAEIQAVLDKRMPGGMVASDPVWLAAFHINERKVKDYRAGRVFLTGDAAHVHSPAGGQGMNTGIQDACNLAWKLALVLQGRAAEEPLLESYSTERSAVGEQVLKAAGRLTEIGILKGEWKQAIRNHVASLVMGLAPARHALADTLTEVSIGYGESPLNAGHGHKPGAGERAPIRPGESPVSSGKTPRFTLFAAGAGAAQTMAKYPALLDPRIRAPFHEGGLWLVRPDGYVALAAKAGAWDEVDELLGSIAGRAESISPSAG